MSEIKSNRSDEASDKDLEKVTAGAVSDDNLESIAGGAISDDSLDSIAGGGVMISGVSPDQEPGKKHSYIGTVTLVK